MIGQAAALMFLCMYDVKNPFIPSGRGGGLVYSDDSDPPYFGENLSFDAIDGKIVLGAA